MKKDFRNTTLFKRAIHDSEHPFTVISNALIQDKRLSFYEIGLMIWILSNSDNYILNMKYAESISGFGKNMNANASKSLQGLGYLKKERIKGGWQWTVNETPHFIEVQQGLNTNVKKSTLNNGGSDVNVDKLTLENEHIINNNEKITEEETNIDEINHYPNSANLNNGNFQSKNEYLDSKRDAVNDNLTDSDASSSIHKETESSDIGYDPTIIQNEIEAFNPAYFKNSNGFLGNVYNEFVKETGNNIPIQEFEKVLLMEIHNQYSMSNSNCNEFSIEVLKQYLLNHTSTITPNSIQSTIKIMGNPKNTDTIRNIFEKYNTNI